MTSGYGPSASSSQQHYLLPTLSQEQIPPLISNQTFDICFDHVSPFSQSNGSANKNSQRKTECEMHNAPANLWVSGFGLSALLLWILSVLRLILFVSLIRAFMNVSISNVNEDIYKNAECPCMSSSFQAFFPVASFQLWDSLAYLSSFCSQEPVNICG